MARIDDIRDALGRVLGEDTGPLTLEPTSGGCINSAGLACVGGRKLFVKWNDHPLPRQFEIEARGLDALRAASRSQDAGLVVPEVIVHGDLGPGRSFLVVENVAEGRRGPDFDEALGRGLARLHRATSAHGFGFATDGYCGATPQPNGWMERWTAFYGERRLGHQLGLAVQAGLGKEEARAIERVIARLPSLIDDDEPPALLHGDLWSGNLLATEEGVPALIDPAAYYGHREAELGMMSLFGGFSSRVYAAYDEERPLRPRWRERLGLYELYHLLNHFNLFGGRSGGGGYGAQAASVARRYG